jgi:AsmA protein
MKKPILISIAIIFVSILVFVPVSFYIFKDDIRVVIEHEIDKQINGTVVFDDMQLNLLSDFPNMSLQLKNVLVKGKGLFEADTLARIPEFDIEIKTFSLFYSKRIEIKSIHLQKPLLHLDVFRGGQANYNSVLEVGSSTKNASDSSSTILALDQMSITDGTVIYNDLSSQLYFEMKALNYVGKGDLSKNVFDLDTKAESGEFTLDYGTIRYFSKKHVKVNMIMEMNLDKHIITFKENDIQINHFKFDIEGNLAILENTLGLDLTFKTKETDFKNILSLVPGIYMEDFKQIKTAGDLAFHGFVKGNYDDNNLPKFMVAIKVSDAMFKIDTLPAPVNNIQLDLVVKNDYGVPDSTIIDLKNFHMDMLAHPIQGRIKLKGYNQFNIDADVFADLDLAELEKMYPIDGIELAGKLKAELKAKGKYKRFSWNDSLHTSQVPSFHVSMKVQNGKLKYNHLPMPVENIQLHALIDNATGKLENTIVDIKGFHLDLGKNPVHGAIKVSGFNNYDITADVKTNLDLADLEKMYPIQSLQMKGILDLDVKANGTYNPTLKKFPLIDANINLTNGYLKSDGSSDAMENIHLLSEAINTTGHVKDTRLAIQQLTYTMEDEPFNVSGSISDLENYNFDLKIKGLIDLAKVTNIYPIKDVQIKGIVDSDIEARGTLADIEKGHYEKIASDGTIEIKDFELKSTALPKTILVKDAFFTFTPLKIIMSRCQGKIGRSSLSITGDLTDYMALFTAKDELMTGDMKVICDTLDLNEWYTPKTVTTASTKTIAINTTQVSNKTAWLVPPDIDFTFDSDIAFVQFQDMKISKLDGEIKIKDSKLTLNETGFNSLNASFNISGDYDTHDKNHPYFDFEVDIQELDINKAYKEIKLVRDMAPAAANTFGQLSIKYKLKGELGNDMSPKTETLTGGGEVRIANAKIDGMKIFEEISKAAKKNEFNNPHLKDFVVKTEIRDNKIFVKPFSIKLSGLNTDIEGVNDIKGALNFIVRIELLPIEKLRIPFHVTGTYDNPKVLIGKGHQLPK